MHMVRGMSSLAAGFCWSCILYMRYGVWCKGLEEDRGVGCWQEGTTYHMDVVLQTLYAVLGTFLIIVWERIWNQTHWLSQVYLSSTIVLDLYMLGLSKTNIPLGCVEHHKFYFMKPVTAKAPSLRLVRQTNNNSNGASQEDAYTYKGTCTTTGWPISHASELHL